MLHAVEQFRIVEEDESKGGPMQSATVSFTTWGGGEGSGVEGFAHLIFELGLLHGVSVFGVREHS